MAERWRYGVEDAISARTHLDWHATPTTLCYIAKLQQRLPVLMHERRAVELLLALVLILTVLLLCLTPVLVPLLVMILLNALIVHAVCTLNCLVVSQVLTPALMKLTRNG